MELQSPDGKGRVTVVQQQVAKVKQTLFQVTDVTQLGSPQDVARLLLPPASTVVSAQVITIPQAPKDTGTVLGVIERPPIQQYRYEVVLRDGQRAEVAVGVILGRVLLLGAVAPEAEWELQRETLRGIADSFKLLPK